MHRVVKSTKSALTLAAALTAFTFAEPASAWQDANEIIATIPPSGGSVADVFIYVDSIRGKVYTGGEVIDANTDTVIKTFPGYSVVAADQIHGKVYARTSGPTLSIIDENTDTVTETIGTHVDPAHAVVDPLHEKLILINDAAPPNVAVTDLHTGAVHTFPLLPITGQPRAVAVDVVRETIYVFIQGDSSPFTATPYSILALDERTGEPKATIPMPVISQWLSVDQGKGLLYAAGTGYSVDNLVDAPGTAIVIDMRTNKILKTVITSPANPPGDEQTITEEVVPDPATNTVYASSFADSTVVAFDVWTGKVTATITMPAKMFGLGIDPIRRKVYAEAPITGTIYVISAPGWGKVALGGRGH